jgi:hypothetical protein
MEHLFALAMLWGGLVVGGAILVYAVVAMATPTRWQLDGTGLTLRAASLLYVPVRVAWDDLNWIRIGTSIQGYLALKLDGRYLFEKHVTLHRNRGHTRQVRFTPADIAQIEDAIERRLRGDPRWQRTDWGWTKASPGPAA